MWDRHEVRTNIVGVLAGIAAMVVLMALVPPWRERLGTLTMVAIVVMAVIALAVRLSRAYVVRIGPDDLRGSWGRVPWSDLDELHLTPGRLEFALTAAAALPRGMTGRIIDPTDPASRTRLSVDYDPARDREVSEAVRSFAPSAVVRFG